MLRPPRSGPRDAWEVEELERWYRTGEPPSPRPSRPHLPPDDEWTFRSLEHHHKPYNWKKDLKQAVEVLIGAVLIYVVLHWPKLGRLFQ